MTLEYSKHTTHNFIRGVNIGGWLVLERYITPYLFTVTSCDVQGDFRYFPNQVDAPTGTNVSLYSSSECTPLDPLPLDEWTLTQSFHDPRIAARYLQIHYDHFVTLQDIETLKRHGVTHVRVPLPHWILQSIQQEPFVSGGAWSYFARLVQWCRNVGIQVWPDLHTAPGSQNGFDNSGHLKSEMTCRGWDTVNSDGPNDDNYDNMDTRNTLPPHVLQTLDILQEITRQIQQDGMTDVVTGFGLLNEPFSDCSIDIVREYYNQGLNIVRTNMGPQTHVYVGDMFDSGRWNDGYWSDDSIYNGTYLDSHIYQSFEVHTRALSPKQHIALVCQRDHVDVVQCCYDNGNPSKGLKRIFAEWSASFDQSVGDQVPSLMQSIVQNGVADKFDRQLSMERKAFLKNFVQAQMVSYEALDAPIESAGWFFWNIKMEGGIFAEWDFLRGIREGWIPVLPERDVPSEHVFGSCYDILNRTEDDMNVIDEIPAPSEYTLSNEGSPIDDDVVLSHGSNLIHTTDGQWIIVYPSNSLLWSLKSIVMIFFSCFLLILWKRYRLQRRRRWEYLSIDDLEMDLSSIILPSNTMGMKHVDTGVESFSSFSEE
jgi:glucan 1,3-beta-glucosidase